MQTAAGGRLPQPEGAVGAAGQGEPAVGAETHGGHRLGVLGERDAAPNRPAAPCAAGGRRGGSTNPLPPAGGRSPGCERASRRHRAARARRRPPASACRPAPAPARTPSTLPARCHWAARATGRRERSGRRGRVHSAQCGIGAGRQDLPATPRQADRMHRPRVSLQGGQAAAGRQLPELDGAVLAAGQGVAAAGAEADRGHAALVPLEGGAGSDRWPRPTVRESGRRCPKGRSWPSALSATASTLSPCPVKRAQALPAGGVPQAERPVAAAGQGVPAVGAPAHGEHRAFVAVEACADKHPSRFPTTSTVPVAAAGQGATAVARSGPPPAPSCCAPRRVRRHCPSSVATAAACGRHCRTGRDGHRR